MILYCILTLVKKFVTLGLVNEEEDMNKATIIKNYLEDFNEEIEATLDGYGDSSAMEFREEEKDNIVRKSNNYLAEVAGKVYEDGMLENFLENRDLYHTMEFGAKILAHIDVNTNGLKNATEEQRYAANCLVYLYPKYSKNFYNLYKIEKEMMKREKINREM